ncbi:carbohydrate ABC transporter permease [Marinithermus hydrothermalis]|uniref:ABC-type transporter, integral membrane subunit n=1 Tax=Marinithermus hydrothermalis (strain DSM 14884 / JCM 11576 / T1) TaxID=869210 RepID=F2NL30_MARHT|nr:carbohydrate ABC transporter permease [Marinithermus hydrothermalis]AEB11433.1 ABC-type transporter, integral membrane subunit [Marinithermus hydrothermalis DSM 14884]
MMQRGVSIFGWVAGGVVGALSGGMVVALWALSATILSGHPTVIPLGAALWSGAIVGLVVGAFRRGRTTPAAVALGVGGLMGFAWWALNSGRPIGLERPDLFWGFFGSLASFALVGHLTRYALRDLDLSQPRRDTVEHLLLRLLRAVGFVFFGTTVTFPFYFMLASSLKSRAEMLLDPTNLSIQFSKGLPELLEGYVEVLYTFNFWRYILNSTFVASVTVVVTLVLGVLGAYAVTRLRFPGKELMSRSILLIYMFPAIVLVVPLYAVFTQLGLRDTLPGLLIVYPATTLPVALYMLRSYFQTLPAELEEAGLIDGCSRIEVIWRITLPLSVPALASVGLYVFMIAWNEFLFAFMFLDTPELFTLSRGMVALNTQEVPRQFLMAGAVIVTVPVMVLFFWFERYLIGGLTAGGVKG